MLLVMNYELEREKMSGNVKKVTLNVVMPKGATEADLELMLDILFFGHMENQEVMSKFDHELDVDHITIE